MPLYIARVNSPILASVYIECLIFKASLRGRIIGRDKILEQVFLEYSKSYYISNTLVRYFTKEYDIF